MQHLFARVVPVMRWFQRMSLRQSDRLHTNDFAFMQLRAMWRYVEFFTLSVL